MITRQIDELGFPKVATPAESLGVRSFINPAIKNGNDVVKFEKFSGPAISTNIVGPFSSFSWGKFLSITAKFGRFMKTAFLAPRHRGNDFVSIFAPHFEGSRRNLLLCLVCVSVSVGVFVSNAFALSALGHGFLGGVTVAPSPKRIASALDADTKTLFGTGFSRPCLDLPRCSVESLTTDRTLEELPGFTIRSAHRMPPLINGVNSVDNFRHNVIIGHNVSKVNTEPSQKRNLLEGATATGRGYGVINAMPVISRMSAPPERDDIAWTVRRRTEDGFKRPIGNIIDETIDTTPQDGMTTAFFPWRQIAGTISISRLEERQNSGEAAILKLLEKKIMQAEMSMKEAVNTQLLQGTVSAATFVDGNSQKDLHPLGYFLRKLEATDPTTTNVGNISGATYSWWRHRVADLGGNSSANADINVSVTTRAALKSYLYRLYNFCVRGGDGSGPNIIVSDQVTYETYEMALDAQKQYTQSKLAELGFDTVKLKGAEMVWDELVPDIYTGTIAITTGTAFFLNLKFWKLVIDTQTDFITTPFVSPENQDAKTAKILFMGNTTTSNLRKLGVAIAISQSITT